MCYSEEVQLATGSIITVSAVAYYLRYAKKYSQPDKQWLKPFLKSIFLVFLCIGLHQLFEYLSLITGNLWIYKIGLIVSICSMYFMLQSLERLTNRKIYSKLSLILIGAVSLHILLSPLVFEGFNFYLRHQSTFFWAAVWLLLFIYWHICVFKIRGEFSDDNSKKATIYYLLAVADISFILSAIYAIVGYWHFSVNVCTDSPSIWCTFYVIQSAFIPLFLGAIPLFFKQPTKQVTYPVKKIIGFLLTSLLILACLVLLLPFFECLSWKFVFP